MVDKAKSKGLIDKWFAHKNAFDAPELPPRIVGWFKGDHIVTSVVVESEGRFVQTRSGSVYELGVADDEYLAHLKANRYAFDPENPFKKVDSFTRLVERDQIN